MHTDNPGTFFGNKGYHFEEEIELNLVGPKNDGESGRMTTFERRPVVAPARTSTAINGGTSWRMELTLATSMSSSPALSARVCQ